MKKLSLIIVIAILFTTIFTANVFAAKNGDILGNVLYTSVKTYINGYQIPVYSINDKMFIIISDLNNYGFDVKYDNVSRTTKAIRNPNKEFTPIEDIDNTHKSGTFAFNYVYTDIKAFIGYKQVESYLINGQIYICFNDLYDYGKAVWDGNTRSLNLTLTDKTPSIYDFYSALFNWYEHGENGNNGIVKSIPSINMNFFGKQNYINPNDFTDMVLMKDGKTVNNKLIYNNSIEQDKWDVGDITNFAFFFEKAITEPGFYRLTGKYKGMDFESDYKIIEQYPIGNTPANPDDFFAVAFRNLENKSSGIVFYFNGIHQSFNIDDLTNLKLTLNGNKINCKLRYNTRYLNYDEENDKVTTFFYMDFNEPLTAPGKYELTGKYMGKEFISWEYSIPYPVGSAPANPDDLEYIFLVCHENEKGKIIDIATFMFLFRGIQEAFYLSDLTDLKLTLNGKEINFEFRDFIPKFIDEFGNTLFDLNLVEYPTSSGTYKLTGKYRGQSFVSQERTIP